MQVLLLFFLAECTIGLAKLVRVVQLLFADVMIDVWWNIKCNQGNGVFSGASAQLISATNSNYNCLQQIGCAFENRLTCSPSRVWNSLKGFSLLMLPCLVLSCLDQRPTANRRTAIDSLMLHRVSLTHIHSRAHTRSRWHFFCCLLVGFACASNPLNRSPPMISCLVRAMHWRIISNWVEFRCRLTIKRKLATAPTGMHRNVAQTRCARARVCSSRTRSNSLMKPTDSGGGGDGGGGGVSSPTRSNTIQNRSVFVNLWADVVVVVVVAAFVLCTILY